jgi:alkanesulfonate monooxygenase SsuD/methylene tetrahydromethanopterin reductase-like flavin-dependent oxidoreductase (luciferase family)
VQVARRVEAAGFRSAWISNHYHPWIDRPAESPFRVDRHRCHRRDTDLTVTTAVTCPLIRVHPR